MKKLKISLLAAVAGISLVLLVGCAPMDPCRSELPWAKPAGWENATPGIGF